jgi:hypothetical protein
MGPAVSGRRKQHVWVDERLRTVVALRVISLLRITLRSRYVRIGEPERPNL